MQATGAQPTTDRVLAEPKVAKLSAGHHAVLPPSELGDLGVDGTKSTKGAHIASFVDSIRHGSIVANEV
jgi:hypothetical protein